MKKLTVFLIALAVLFTILALCGIITNPPSADDYAVLISHYADIINFNSALDDLSQLQLIMWRYKSLSFFMFYDDYPDMWVEENEDGTYTLMVQPQSEFSYPEGFIGPIYRPIEEFTFTSYNEAATAAVWALPGADVALDYQTMLSHQRIEELVRLPLADWITTPVKGVFNVLTSFVGGVSAVAGVVISFLYDAVFAGAYTIRWILAL